MEHFSSESHEENKIWAKGIPITNKVFMVISLLLVFGLDLLIIVSNPSLFMFWAIMIGVLAVFSVFFFLENYFFRNKFLHNKSPLDGWLYVIILARNIIFILNFIPIIQLFGLMLLGGWVAGSLFGGGGFIFSIFSMVMPVLTLIYVALIIARFHQTKKISPNL